MSVIFILEESTLIMEYSPEEENVSDLYTKLLNGEERNIRRCFKVNVNNNPKLNENEEIIRFDVGKLEGDYIKLDNEVFGTDNNFYFYKDVEIKENMFRAAFNVSIIRKIDHIVDGDVYIGGDKENHIPIKLFKHLIKSFPKNSELSNYVYSRISLILEDYYPKSRKYIELYEKNLEKTEQELSSIIKKNDDLLLKDNYKISLIQFENLLNDYQKLLEHGNEYNELNWQRQIKKIMQFIYPKYTYDLKGIRMPGIDRRDKIPDFLLVDSDGYVDVMEIKRPEARLMSDNNNHRNNYVSSRDLSEAIQQLEKYILCLNKWGNEGEKKIRNKLNDNVDLDIRIINPKGILIMGRSNGLNMQQSQDFEIIRRQYRNIAEIITYDDITNRIRNIINSIKLKLNNYHK